MTPEDVESRLRSLEMPRPSEQLRARCLAPQPPASRSRMAFAMAASFLVVALTGWLILTPTAPVKPPDGNLVEPGTVPIARPDDPRLQEKVDALFRKNPGKAILVVQVRELKNGAYVPVTKGFNLKILLDPADQAPSKDPGGPHATVDAEGTLLFVMAPGRYRGRGSQGNYDRLKDFYGVWEYPDFTLLPGDIVHLPDVVLAPWMEWVSPEEGSVISLTLDPAISWKANAEVREVRVEVDRVTSSSRGIFKLESLGVLKRDRPVDNRIALSELLKVVRPPFKIGDTLELTLEGYGGDGKLLTACKTRRRFTLKD